jgi:hypothetical protein
MLLDLSRVVLRLAVMIAIFIGVIFGPTWPVAGIVAVIAVPAVAMFAAETLKVLGPGPRAQLALQAARDAERAEAEGGEAAEAEGGETRSG